MGFDVICIKAKRWQDSVGRPELQRFVGALHGHHARKGVFLTTSTFTRDAVDYAAKVDSKVVLIDRRRLAELMIDFDLGVATTATYAVKRVDSDYFDEEWRSIEARPPWRNPREQSKNEEPGVSAGLS